MPDRALASAPSWRPVALLVAGAYFMENLDGTIIATAAPKMARSFGVAPSALNVAIIAYLLTLGVFIPVSGWVADRFGTRRVFAFAVVVFTVASILCAASTGLDELTAVRVLQGVGGAMMVPVGRLVVLRSAQRHEYISAVAYLTWPALAAPLIAPVVGGALATYASWRWIFLINVPLGVIALVYTFRLIADERGEQRDPLDWRGFVYTGAGITGVVVGIEALAGARLDWTLAAIGVVAGGLFLTVAFHHLRRVAAPLLVFEEMRIATFRVTNVGGTFFRLAIGALPFLLPLLFQDAFGWSPFKSGLLVIAVFAGNITIKPFTTVMLHRLGFRRVLVLAGVLASLFVGLCATFSASTPIPVMAVVLFASGVFRSIGFTAYNAIVYSDVPGEYLNRANTLTSSIQQLTLGLGVAAGALALRVGASVVGQFHAGHDATAPFRAAFLLLAVLPVVAAIGSARLPGDAGSRVMTPSAHDEVRGS